MSSSVVLEPSVGRTEPTGPTGPSGAQCAQAVVEHSMEPESQLLILE